MKKLLSMSFEDALTKIPEALKTKGFGVLTEIDVQKTLAQKLQVSFRRYKILGACNPTFAHRALSLELDAVRSVFRDPGPWRACAANGLRDG